MGRQGELVVVGSGIKAVGQFTLEAQAHIQQADVVLYAAADPVTDMWIERQNPNTFDLYQYYSNDRNRIITYVQMVERILDEVRAGKRVCAVFYGHPGVFVTPSHNAVELARREGYEARMLPAVSAEDCLYADLGVDPSVPGLQVFEATDLLLRRRRLEPSMNVILFQVGCVGDLGFRFDGYANDNFPVLVDYLEEAYGPEQELVNYVASMFNTADTTIARHTIGELRDPDVAKTITGVSTFFIPAAASAESDPEIGAKLGLRVGPTRGTPLICDRADYPRLKEIAGRNNLNHSVPAGYRFSNASEALYEALRELSLDVEAEAAFRRDPDAYLAEIEGLTPRERRYLAMRHPGMIRALFKADPDEEAERFVLRALADPYLADSWRAKQGVEHAARRRGETDPSQYQAALCDWLREQGFATTPAAVTRAARALRPIRADAEVEPDAERAPVAAAEGVGD